MELDWFDVISLSSETWSVCVQRACGASWLKLGLIGSQSSAQSPPYSPRLTDALSHFPCPVPAEVRAQPQARRPLIPPQRKWPVLFSWHISTSPHKLLTRPLFGPCTSACKVRHRNRSYRWRDSEVSTLLPYLTMSFVMSWHFWLTLGGRNARKEQESLPQVHSIICWIKLFPTCFIQKVFTKTRQTYSWHCWLQDWKVKLPLWLHMWDICPGLLPAAATEKKRNKITDWKLWSNELQTKHSISEWMRE